MIGLPNLRTLTIGNESFKQATSFSISTLLSLETVEIGDNCFGAIANSIYINSLPELTSLKIGRYSFYDKTSDNRVNCTFQVFNCSQLKLVNIVSVNMKVNSNSYLFLLYKILQSDRLRMNRTTSCILQNSILDV